MAAGVEGAAPGGLAVTGQLQHTATTRKVPESHLQEEPSEGQPRGTRIHNKTLCVGVDLDVELTVVSPLVVANFAPSG